MTKLNIEIPIQLHIGEIEIIESLNNVYENLKLNNNENESIKEMCFSHEGLFFKLVNIAVNIDRINQYETFERNYYQLIQYDNKDNIKAYYNFFVSQKARKYCFNKEIKNSLLKKDLENNKDYYFEPTVFVFPI